MNKLVNAAEAATVLGISPSAFSKRVKAGKLDLNAVEADGKSAYELEAVLAIRKSYFNGAALTRQQYSKWNQLSLLTKGLIPLGAAGFLLSFAAGVVSMTQAVLSSGSYLTGILLLAIPPFFLMMPMASYRRDRERIPWAMLYTSNQAAAYLSIPATRLQRWVREERIIPFERFSNKLLWSESQLDELAQQIKDDTVPEIGAVNEFRSLADIVYKVVYWVLVPLTFFNLFMSLVVTFADGLESASDLLSLIRTIVTFAGVVLVLIVLKAIKTGALQVKLKIK